MLIDHQIPVFCLIIVMILFLFAFTGSYATAKVGSSTRKFTGFALLGMFFLIVGMLELFGVGGVHEGHPALSDDLVPGKYRIVASNHERIPPKHEDGPGYEELRVVEKIGGKPADWAFIRVNEKEWFPISGCFEAFQTIPPSMIQCPEDKFESTPLELSLPLPR